MEEMSDNELLSHFESECKSLQSCLEYTLADIKKYQSTYRQMKVRLEYNQKLLNELRKKKEPEKEQSKHEDKAEKNSMFVKLVSKNGNRSFEGYI